MHLSTQMHHEHDRIKQPIYLSDPFFSYFQFDIFPKIFRSMCSIIRSNDALYKMKYIYIHNMEERRKMSYISSLISSYQCLLSLFIRLISEGFLKKKFFFLSSFSSISYVNDIRLYYNIFFHVVYNICINKKKLTRQKIISQVYTYMYIYLYTSHDYLQITYLLSFYRILPSQLL